MTTTTRIAFLLVAALIAIGAFVVLGGDGDDPSTESAATPAAGSTPSPGEQPDSDETAAAPSDEPEPEPTPEPMQTIRIRDGAPVGGVAEIAVTRGERIRFAVRSDVADHVHVHGFDIFRDVGPGQVARFSFPADIEGVFEVELEDRHVPIAELTVSPS